MKTIPFSLAVSSAIALLTVSTAHGQAPSKVSGKDYALTHSSSFDAPPNGSRNPFWPIGWTPSATVGPAQTAVVQQAEVKAEQFVVTTISVDYPPLAIINGKSYGVNDHIPVTADSREFVTVKQILDGVVVLDYHGRELRSTTNAGGMVRRTK